MSLNSATSSTPTTTTDIVVIDLNNTLLTRLRYNYDMCDQQLITSLKLQNAFSLNKCKEYFQTQVELNKINDSILQIARLASKAPNCALILTSQNKNYDPELYNEFLNKWNIKPDHTFFNEHDKAPFFHAKYNIFSIEGLYPSAIRCNILTTSCEEQNAYLQYADQFVDPKFDIPNVRLPIYILSPLEQREFLTKVLANEFYELEGFIQHVDWRMKFSLDVKSQLVALLFEISKVDNLNILQIQPLELRLGVDKPSFDSLEFSVTKYGIKDQRLILEIVSGFNVYEVGARIKQDYLKPPSDIPVVNPISKFTGYVYHHQNLTLHKKLIV